MITIDQARQYYHEAESAHDFDHVLRVYTLAERIAQAEGANLDIVRVNQLAMQNVHMVKPRLEDVFVLMLAKQGTNDSPRQISHQGGV